MQVRLQNNSKNLSKDGRKWKFGTYICTSGIAGTITNRVYETVISVAN